MCLDMVTKNAVQFTNMMSIAIVTFLFDDSGIISGVLLQNNFAVDLL